MDTQKISWKWLNSDQKHALRGRRHEKQLNQDPYLCSSYAMTLHESSERSPISRYGRLYIRIVWMVKEVSPASKQKTAVYDRSGWW